MPGDGTESGPDSTSTEGSSIHSGGKKSNPPKPPNKTIPNWIIALILIFALSIIGLTVSIVTGSFIPIWTMLGFSLIFSVERWFGYITRKSKWIGKLYRLILNLCILSLLGLLVWSGIKLFSHQFVRSSIAGSLIFLAEFIFFIWMWRVVSKNSWRWPSMKLTVFSLIVLFVIFAFAGVSPFVEMKNSAFQSIGTWFSSLNNPKTLNPSQTSDLFLSKTPNPTLSPSNTTTNTALTPSNFANIPSLTPSPTITPIEIKKIGINSRTGIYNNYFLGLVKDLEGVNGGSDCYGDFIILINNTNAKNPTYSELLTFLKADKTDEFPYQLKISALGSYFGMAEDKIDLNLVKNIIDGIEQPKSPKVCADFAERLHNNAEKAGIRCGYITLALGGAGHALNVFDTSDNGLIYIDDTGITSSGPSNCDKVVDLQSGKPYIPQSLFPSPGWNSSWEDMGIAANIFIAWDGEWR